VITLITINKAILHILDFNSNVTVFSEKELDIGNNSVWTFLSKHIEKTYKELSSKTGAFHPESKFKDRISDYVINGHDFIAFSTAIAAAMHESISQSDKLDSTDLLIIDFSIDDIRLLAILKCDNKVGFTHQVISEDDKIKNEIINHYAILPNVSQKIDEYAFIELDSLKIKFNEKKRSVNGHDAFILSEIILECSSTISPKDTISLVKSITREIAENHGKSSVEALAKVKTHIAENAEISESLDMTELGREVFNSSPLMQQEYMQELKSSGIPDTVKLDRDFAVKSGKNHKIKTDTGIEITFPVDYFQNKDYIEFVNNADGTISIELKNIGKITNK